VIRRALLAALLMALLAAPSLAAAPTPPWTGNAGQLDRTIDYMRSAQNADGGFGGVKGAPSDPLFTAWVILGLAAAGINPRDQKLVGGTDAYTYVTQHPKALELTTDLERAMLVSIAAGASPRDFGGRDLVAATLQRRLPDGSFTHAAGGTRGGINDTAFAMLTLGTIRGIDDGTDLVARGAAWLVGTQGADGGWSYAPGAGESSDMTAAVIQALRMAPTTAARRAAVARGWAYLRTTQRDDGGFAETPHDDESNTASTAWALQALWAAGVDPATWRHGGATPLDYLAAMQQPDGSIKYKKDEDMNNLWMTAYAAPALAGYPLPVPDVARADANGEGGGGAPLYSRPQAGSTGAASGGIRELSSTSRSTRTQRRPGAKRVATGTAQSNGVAASGVTPVASNTKDTNKTGRAPSSSSAPTASVTAPPPSTAVPSSTTPQQEVTGRLLGSGEAAPAGVSGAGTQPAAAPGLRTARHADDGTSPATVRILAALIAAAALLGGAIELRSGRRGLTP
jgi:prenyltransferase beta subunit